MKFKILSFLLTLVLVLGIIGVGCDSKTSLPTAKPEDVGMSSERLERINTIMQEYIDQQLLPCTVTLVARHGKIVHLEAQGWKDMDNEIPVEEDDIFRMFSMTKPITTVAILILYEEGRLQLEDPVSLYIPAFQNQVVTVGDETVPAAREVTIRDLLTHTSGIGYYVPGGDNTSPIEDFMDSVAGLPLAFQPGTEWKYGFGHSIAGVVVEEVSGKTLDEFFKERIFEPLEMKDSSFYLPVEKAFRLVLEYFVKKEGDIYELVYPPLYSGSSTKVEGPKAQFGGGGWGGGVCSTIQDYARFCQMLLNGGELDGVRIISRKSVELMTTSHTGDLLISSAYPGYGMGLGVSVRRDIVTAPRIGSVGRFGWGGADYTYFFVDPEEDLVVIFFSQVTNYYSAPELGRLRPIIDALVYSALE